MQLTGLLTSRLRKKIAFPKRIFIDSLPAFFCRLQVTHWVAFFCFLVIDFWNVQNITGDIDNNLVMIGAGGLVSAYIAVAVKARVTLIEKHEMRDDCLNTGCVPSKALIRSAKFMSHIKRAKDFGISEASHVPNLPMCVNVIKGEAKLALLIL